MTMTSRLHLYWSSWSSLFQIILQ